MRISRPLRDWSYWPIVPSTGSALYLRSHPVQLVCAEPYWAIIRSSLRDFTLQTAVATRGRERNAASTELCACDPALDQQSGKAGTNVETQGTALAVPHKDRVDEGFTGRGKTKFFEGDGF